MSLFPLYDSSRDYSNMVAIAKSDVYENVVHRTVQALIDCLKKCSMASRRSKVRKSLISLCDAQMFAELYMQLGANGLVRLSGYDMSSDEGIAMMQKVKGYDEFDPDDFHGYGERNAQFLEKFAESVIKKHNAGLKLSQMEQSLCDTLRCDDAAAAHISMD